MLSRCDPFRLPVEETGGSPSFPGVPNRRSALLSDPGRTSTPNHIGVSVLPPLFQQRRLPHLPFRGSITRLHDPLPTLEDAISGRRPRLASGGWSTLSGRIGYRRVSVEAFSHSLFLRSPFGLWFQSNERHPRFSGLWLAPWKLARGNSTLHPSQLGSLSEHDLCRTLLASNRPADPRPRSGASARRRRLHHSPLPRPSRIRAAPRLFTRGAGFPIVV